jgi:hypothetical protein
LLKGLDRSTLADLRTAQNNLGDIMHWRMKAWEDMGPEMASLILEKWQSSDVLALKHFEVFTGTTAQTMGKTLRRFLDEGPLPKAEADALKSLIYKEGRMTEVSFELVEAAMRYEFPEKQYVRPKNGEKRVKHLSREHLARKMQAAEDLANKNEWLAMRRAIRLREAPLDLRYFPDLKEPLFFKRLGYIGQKKARVKYGKRPWLLLDLDWETGKPLKRS